MPDTTVKPFPKSIHPGEKGNPSEADMTRFGITESEMSPAQLASYNRLQQMQGKQVSETPSGGTTPFGISTGEMSPGQLASWNRLQQMQGQRAPIIPGMGGPGQTSSVRITQPTYQPISPEMTRYMGEAERLIAGLEGVGKEAQGAYEGLISGLGGAYGTRGSRAAGTSRQAALATGLTPLEAATVGGEAQNEAMREYYAMLPQLRLQQAEIPGKYMEMGAGLWGDLANLYRMAGQVPGETRQWDIDYGGEQTGEAGGGAAPRDILGGGDRRLRHAQEMYIRAQTAEQRRLSAAREMMNRIFYGGGLGPVAGGPLGPPQQPQREAAPVGGRTAYPQVTQQPQLTERQRTEQRAFAAGGGRGTRPVKGAEKKAEDYWSWYMGS